MVLLAHESVLVIPASSHGSRMPLNNGAHRCREPGRKMGICHAWAVGWGNGPLKGGPGAGVGFHLARFPLQMQAIDATKKASVTSKPWAVQRGKRLEAASIGARRVHR